MSVSEFYYGHGIGPSHQPHNMCNFQHRPASDENWYAAAASAASREESNDVGVMSTKFQVQASLHKTHAVVGGCVGGSMGIGMGHNRKRPRNCVLDESSLDDLADRHGYAKITIPLRSAPLASYRRGSCRLNFWLTTGNVGSYLDHPTQGKSLLVRRDIQLHEAEAVFQNPMHHAASRGYR